MRRFWTSERFLKYGNVTEYEIPDHTLGTTALPPLLRDASAIHGTLFTMCYSR